MIEQRIVPGAPPPAPLSKSQKKKRKAKVKPTESNTVSIPDTTSAALVEKILETTNIQEGAVTLDLVTEPQLEDSLPEEVLLKPSPIVELIHKRLKATTKKISRISIYASTDPEKLNDDQKRTLKTLPTLEAVQKELGEVQKAVEVHEGELVHELASKRAEAAKAERARIADAVAAKEAFNKSKFSTILSFARLHTLIQAADPEALALNLDSAESRAILASADALLGENSDLKQTVIDGFLSGEGEIESVTYSRLLDITELYLNPPRIPTPVQEQVEEQPELKTPLSSVGTGPEVPVIGIPETIPTSGSFHFMQASELETPSLEGAEWVDRGDAVAQEEELRPEFVVEAVNGHNNMDQPIAVSLPVTAEAVVSGNEPIDWADEEGGLPSIDGLHAKFGTSGTATPVIKTPEQVETPVLPVNGDVNTTLPREEEDGFQQARGGRGRGRGFRGVELRGGFRGSFRGGDRGFRGNDRGFRGGGFRGGERGGGFRGKPSNGEWRGGSANGYGEFRGRGGRGRGRGDRHPDRPPVVSTT